MKLEQTLISLANQHLHEARNWANEDGSLGAIQEQARTLGVSVDALCRREMSDAITRCVAIVEIANLDTDIDESTRKSLLAVEEALASLDRVGDKPESN